MTKEKGAKTARSHSVLAADDRQVKRELLRSAMRLLSQYGREGATSRAICAEVGVGAPAIYHHYGDLAALHHAAIDETFRQVAATYRRSAKKRGPLAGIRDSWALFMHFAYEEPAMCRLVIQQILAGDAPRAVKGTLQKVAHDLEGCRDQGTLAIRPDDASKLLWMGALGALSFTATDSPDAHANYPKLQNMLIDIILKSLFTSSSEPASPE